MSLAETLLLPTADDDPSYRAAMQVYYKCDESSGDLLDYFGNCNLTDTNTVGSAAGNVGNARSFVAASSEYFTRAHNAKLAFSGVGAWSFVASARPGSVHDGVVVNRGSGAGAELSLLFRSGAGGIDLFISNAGTTIAGVNEPAGYVGNTWYFLRAWFDPAVGTHGTAYLRVNEGTTRSTALSSAWNTQTVNFNVGVQNNLSLALYYGGRLDEIAKFNRVLTAAEAAELYSRFQTNRAIL